MSITLSPILKNMSAYASSAVLAQGVGLVANFVVAQQLGPTDYGIWSAASLALVYGSYFDLGILPAMGRDLPAQLGDERYEAAHAIESAALTATLISSALVALVISGLSFAPTLSPKMAFSLRGLALTLIVTRLYNYYLTVLRSYNEFTRLSQLQTLLALCNAALVIVGVIVGGLEGRVLAGLAAQTLVLVVALQARQWHGRLRVNLDVIWRLIRVGVPIILSSIILGFISTIDRVVIVTYLGETQLGYFGIALLAINFISLIPVMSMQVLYPKMSAAYGAEGNLERLRPFVHSPSVLLGYGLPWLIGPLYLLLPAFILQFLPAYREGISAARIVLIGIFFYNVLGLADYFLVVIGKLKQYILICGATLIINGVLDVSFIALRWQLTGIALGGTLITYGLYALMIITYAQRHFIHQPLALTRYLGEIGLLFLAMLVGLLGTDWLMTQLAMPTLWGAGVGAVVFALGWGIVIGIRRTRWLALWHALAEGG